MHPIYILLGMRYSSWFRVFVVWSGIGVVAQASKERREAWYLLYVYLCACTK